MNNEFLWIKPRHLYRISIAMREAETDIELQSLKKILYRGLKEWAVGVSAVLAFIAGCLAYHDASHFVIALAAGL